MYTFLLVNLFCCRGLSHDPRMDRHLSSAALPPSPGGLGQLSAGSQAKVGHSQVVATATKWTPLPTTNPLSSPAFASQAADPFHWVRAPSVTFQRMHSDGHPCVVVSTGVPVLPYWGKRWAQIRCVGQQVGVHNPHPLTSQKSGAAEHMQAREGRTPT